MPSFDPIRPAPVVDSFIFDFSSDIGSLAAITSASWTCAKAPESVVDDPTPGIRVVGPVVISATATSCLVGLMLDGVIYRLTATVIVNDGRTLAQSGDVLCTLNPSPEGVVGDLTVEEFRATFSAFADASLYPDVAISYWIGQAPNALDVTRWGQFYDQGLRLYVAHMLAVNRMAGSMTGAPVGAAIPQSKSVGGVSISYDVEFGSEEGAGAWNLTIWGSQFYRLQLAAGAGTIQL